MPNTLKSIFDQDFQDWELVAVDDGSTDDSLKILQSLDDPRVKVITQSNQGAGAARNTAIEHATGQYLAFLDSDDLWEPFHLRSHYEAIEEKMKPVAFFRSFIKFLENGEETDAQPMVENTFPTSVEYAMQVALYPTACTFHRDLFRDIRFNTAIKINIDAECFIRIAAITPIYVIKEYTGFVLRHPGNLSAGNVRNYQRQIEVWQKIRQYPGVKAHLPRFYIQRLLANYHFWIFSHQETSFSEGFKHLWAMLNLQPSRVTESLVWKVILKKIISGK